MAKFVDNMLSIFRRKVPPSQTAGVPGTRVFGGYVQPIEDRSRLVGRERYRTFSEMMANVTIVAAGVRFYLNLCAKADWKVEAPEDSGPQGEEIAELIDSMLHDMDTPWHRAVRRACMYRHYGFSLQEWTAKQRDDGAIGMKDLAPRAQLTIERWDMLDDGNVAGVLQRSPQDHQEIYIPRNKMVYVVDDSVSDSPEGLGLLRHVVKASEELQRFEQLEGFGFETDLRGMPVGRGPFAKLQEAVANGTISAKERQQLEQPLLDFIQNHIKSPQLGLLLDSITYQTEDDKATPSTTRQWDMELLKSGSTSQEAVAAAISRKNREIARVLGVENLLVGETGAGSMALSKDKSQNFSLIVDGALKEVGESMEADLLTPIMEMNGWPEELTPTLKPDKVQFRDVQEVTQALVDMARAGAILDPMDPAVGEVRDLLGLSRPDPDLILIDSVLGGDEPEDPDKPKDDEEEKEVPEGEEGEDE